MIIPMVVFWVAIITDMLFPIVEIILMIWLIKKLNDLEN